MTWKNSLIEGTPFCLFPTNVTPKFGALLFVSIPQKNVSPELEALSKKKKKKHDSQTSLHFISLIAFEDLIQQCLKRRSKFDYMYLMTLILFNQKDWLDS